MSRALQVGDHGPRPRIRNLRLSRDRDGLQTRTLMLSIGAGLLVLVPLLTNVWGRAEAVRLGYRLQAAREARVTLQEQNRKLRVERAAHADLAAIERRAVEELGLAPRQPSATVVVSIVGGEPRPPAEPAPRVVVTTQEHQSAAGARP